MSMERTLSIIKPDAVAKNAIGQICARFEAAGLRIVAARMVHIARARAEAFYAVHAERSFYSELCASMSSGPVVVQVLEGENAIAHYREIMGATNPANAKDGTIRKQFGQNVQENSVHGSDSEETAAAEIAFFFSDLEIVG